MNEWISEWMHELMNEWMNEWKKNERMSDWINRRVSEHSALRPVESIPLKCLYWSKRGSNELSKLKRKETK